MLFWINTYGQTINFLDNNVRVADVWSVNIAVAQSKNVYLQSKIESNTKGLLYQARTNQFQLREGRHSFNVLNFPNIIIQFSDIDNTDIPLTEGIYTFTIQLIDFQTNQVISEARSLSTIQETGSTTVENETKTKDKFQYSINASIINQQVFDFGTDYFDINYTRVMLSPSVQLFGLPFSANINLSKEQNIPFGFANHFNFSFDYRQYLQTVQNMLNTTLEDNEKYQKLNQKLKSENLDKISKNIKNIESLKEQLKSPEILDKLKSIEQLNSLKALKNDKEIKSKVNQYNLLQKEFKGNSLEELPTKLTESKFEKLTDSKGEGKLNKVLKNKSLTQYFKSNPAKSAENLKKINDLKNKDNFFNLLSESKNLEDFNSKVDILKKQKSLIVDSLGIETGKTKRSKSKSESINPSKLNNLSIDYFDIKKYDDLAKSLDENSFINLKTLNQEEIVAITNNTSYEELNNISKIISSGLDSYSKIEKVKSLSELKQIININKEFRQIETKIKEIAQNKRAYKKLIKTKSALDKIDNLDVKEIYKNPKSLVTTAKNLELLSPAMKFFESFRVLDVGYVFPIYNRFMLNGIRNKGANIEIAPKKLYFGITSGKSQNILSPTQPNDSLFFQESRQVNAVKIGVGEKLGDHIHVNYLLATDNSLIALTGIKQTNHVVGVDFIYTLLKNVNLIGEYNFSILSSSNSHLDSKSSINGHALFVRPAYLLKKGGDIYGQCEIVSGDYNSFGLPYLINGRKIYELGLNLPLFKNQILINTSIRKDIINNPLFNNSSSNIYSALVHFKKEKLPYASINYSLAQISNQIEIGKNVKNSVQQFGIVTGYNFNLKSTNLSTQIAFNINNNYQINNTSFIEDGNINVSYLIANYQKNKSVSLTQQIQLNKFGLGLRGSIINFDSMDESLNTNLYTIENSISVPLFKNKLNTQISYTYGRQNKDSKMGYNMMLTYLINKNLNFMFNLRNDFIHINQMEAPGSVKGLTLFGQLNLNF